MLKVIRFGIQQGGPRRESFVVRGLCISVFCFYVGALRVGFMMARCVYWPQKLLGLIPWGEPRVVFYPSNRANGVSLEFLS